MSNEYSATTGFEETQLFELSPPQQSDSFMFTFLVVIEKTAHTRLEKKFVGQSTIVIYVLICSILIHVRSGLKVRI